MARVEIASQAWGWVADAHGEGQSGASVQIKNLDGTNATHWSALSGGSSSTGLISTNTDGTLPRYIEGGTYELWVGGVLKGRVEAVTGPVVSATDAPAGVGATDTAALTAQIAAGRIVQLRAGTYVITGLSSALNNVTIRGLGRGVTTIQLANSQNTHALDITGNGWTLEDLTIDGNRANQSAGHCLRIAGDDHKLQRLIVKNAKEYGIGMAQAAASTVRRMHIDSVYVLNTGLDGIESKDKAHTNTGNRISNVVVENHGLDGTTSAGMDCRGPWQLSNVSVLGITSSNTGVRFRESDSGTTGFGADGSSLSNFRIVGSSTAGSIGVSVPSDNVTVANGYAESLAIGYSMGGDNVSVDNATAKNCNVSSSGVGFDVDSGGDFATLRGCIADGCWDGFTTDADNTLIEGGAARNSGRYGINPATSTNLRIRNVRYANNATKDVNYSTTASAAALTIPSFTDHILVSGTTNITSISTSWNDRVITLRFQGILTVTDGGNLALNGNFVTSVQDTITLLSDGSVWYELARSAN